MLLERDSGAVVLERILLTETRRSKVNRDRGPGIERDQVAVQVNRGIMEAMPMHSVELD